MHDPARVAEAQKCGKRTRKRTDRSNGGAGTGLTLALSVTEVVQCSVVVTRLDWVIRVEIIAELNADSFTPRVAAHAVDDPIAMSTRLLVFIRPSAFVRCMHILYYIALHIIGLSNTKQLEKYAGYRHYCAAVRLRLRNLTLTPTVTATFDCLN